MDKKSREKETIVSSLFALSTMTEYFHGKIKEEEILIKEDNSPVTIYDFCTQIILNYELQKSFPNVPIMGEERADDLRNPKNEAFFNRIEEVLAPILPSISKKEILELLDWGSFEGGKGRFWVIDPIDGTKGFISKGEYALAIALMDEGKPILGALSCPAWRQGKHKGVLFYAERQKGSEYLFLDNDHFAPLHVSKKVDDDFVYVEPPKNSTFHSHNLAKELALEFHQDPLSLQLDSQVKYTSVALGIAPLYLRVPKKKSKREKIWDHAPGVIILEEAGGRVTDLKGNALDFSQGDSLTNNYGLIASNGSPIHNKVLTAAERILNL